MVGIDDILICGYVDGSFDLWLVRDFVVSRDKICAIVFDGKDLFTVSAKQFKEYGLVKIGEL
jgi:hypothetical protein